MGDASVLVGVVLSAALLADVVVSVLAYLVAVELAERQQSAASCTFLQIVVLMLWLGKTLPTLDKSLPTLDKSLPTLGKSLPTLGKTLLCLAAGAVRRVAVAVRRAAAGVTVQEPD